LFFGFGTVFLLLDDYYPTKTFLVSTFCSQSR